MPLRAPSVCACGRVVAAGVRCSCRVAADRQRAKAQDAKRGSARERGYDSKWQLARLAFLAMNPTCVMCSAPATVVDHKTPHRGDTKLFWSKSNWQSLCKTCHCSTKQSQERAR